MAGLKIRVPESPIWVEMVRAFGAAQALIMLETQTPMLRISAAWGVAALPVSAIFALVHVIRHLVCSGVGQTLWPVDIAGVREGGH